MLMNCGHATQWTEGGVSIVELRQLVSIELDRTKMTADDAVVWVTSSPGGLSDVQHVRIALMGHARLEQEGIVRTD